MDAPLTVADAQVDAEDYYFDLDAGADTGADVGVEDFDFKLDGTYDDGTHAEAGDANTVSVTEVTAEFEIGYEEEEPGVQIENDTTKAGDEEHDADQGSGAEYQDEIGYEEEELGATAAVADSRAAESGSPGAGQDSVAQDHGEPEVLDDQAVNDGFEEPNQEELSAFDVGANAPADVNDGASTHHSHQDNTQTPGSGDPQETPADMSSASLVSTTPEITVHYNQGRYSLIGAPSDDPDSYFLSDPKDLDASLSQILSSIRAVISDEVPPQDELVIRIDALDLEFGEKSNQKFLDRSFHEIFRCFTALLGDSENETQELELDLLVRRDCETRFIELLEEAGLADEAADHSTGFGGVEDEDFEDVSIDDFQEDFQTGEDLMAVTTGDGSPEAAQQDQKVATPEAAPQHEEANMGTSLQFPSNPGGTGSGDLTQLEGGNDENFEDEYLEIQSGPTNEIDAAEASEASALEEMDATDELGQAFASDEMFGEQELAIDMTEQSVLEQEAHDWGGDLGGQAGLDTGEVSATEVGAAGMLEPTLHDNEATSSLSAESALPTIPEQGAVGDFDLSRGTDPTGSGFLMDNSVPREGKITDTQEVKSLQTSRTSTVNGDEMGHDEYSQADHLPPKQGLEQPGTPKGEIGWESDGEEDGEQNLAAPTPSGKRSRTNETDGLSDGTDNKRRRT